MAPVLPLGSVDVNEPVEIPPMVFPKPLLKILMPNCSDLVRSMLIKRTLRRICGSDTGTETLSKLMTLPPVEAILTARSELMRSMTVPRRKIAPFSELTLRESPGSSALSSRRIASRLSCKTVALARTVTLKN